MKQKICTLLCILSIIGLYIPNTTHADTSEVQHAQLEAIRAYLSRTYAPNTTPLTEAELHDVIHAGISWMQNAQEENGHFKYEYVPYEDTYKNDDNIVRQAGALYILGEAVRSGQNTDGIDKTIEKAIGYFETLSKTGTYNGETFRCIVEKTTSKRCKLGATSLALIGTLSYVDAYPEKASDYNDLIESYSTYILAMQKESGGFREVYRTDIRDALDKESSFANGEALLALVRSYKHKKDDDTRKAIDTAVMYLKAQPFDANLYLWIMAAVKDMNTLWTKDEYKEYAHAFTEWRLAYGVKHSHTRNYCAYAEGIASAGSLLKDDPLYTKLRTELDLRNKSHHALQLQKSDAFRIIETQGKLTLKELKNSTYALGGFLVSDAEATQRIDFTQHCLGAYIQTLVDLK